MTHAPHASHGPYGPHGPHGPHPTVVIRDGRAVCGETGLDAITDIVIVDGKIAALGPQATGPRASVPSDAVVIDAQGAWVLPGMIDLGVHVREPGREHDEDLRTTLELALMGGVTTLLALPDTTPAVDGADDVLHRRAAWSMAAARANEELRARAALDATDNVRATSKGPGARRVTDVVAPSLVVAGALTRRREGKEPADASDMANVGVDVFSDAAYIDDNEVLRRALEYARGAGGKLALLHGPDAALARGGVVVEGEVATRLGLAGIPELADALAAFRHAEMAKLVGMDVHLGPLFTGAALDVLARSSAAATSSPGVARVTAEVTPWHLLLDERAHLERRYDTLLRLDPPLPTASSRARLLDAVKQGVLAISSGHRPVPNRTKDLEMAIAEPGASALSLTLPLLCALLSPLELARATSALPARILGMSDRGRLTVGARADVVLLRPAATVAGGELVDAALCGKMAPANPWLGRRTAGRIDITLVGGRVAWQRASDSLAEDRAR